MPTVQSAQPRLALLHTAMLLSGFGTVFLGPVLPRLAAIAHTSDSGSGLFFLAQFLGAFCGGVTTTSRLWRSLLRGCGAACIGFLLLALCTGWHTQLGWYIAALLPLGFGVGQMLTSVNLLASQRFAEGKGAALSLVNFSWSLGAVTAPFLLGNVLHAVALQSIFAVAATLYLLVLLFTLWNATRAVYGSQQTQQPVESGSTLRKSAFVYFALQLFTYGGVETCLGGWTTTFGQRYGGEANGIAGSSAGAVATTALWLGLTVGRALVPLLLRRVGERSLLRGVLLTAAVLTGLLSRSHGGLQLVVTCALLGLSLAPWFPLVLATMLEAGAGASQVGSIIAASGIGAALLPLLVGALSRSSGSLRLALLVPLSGLTILLLMSVWRVGLGRPVSPSRGV